MPEGLGRGLPTLALGETLVHRLELHLKAHLDHLEGVLLPICQTWSIAKRAATTGRQFLCVTTQCEMPSTELSYFKICKIGIENKDLFREKDARFDIEGNKCGNFSDFS